LGFGACYDLGDFFFTGVGGNPIFRHYFNDRGIPGKAFFLEALFLQFLCAAASLDRGAYYVSAEVGRHFATVSQCFGYPWRGRFSGALFLQFLCVAASPFNPRPVTAAQKLSQKRLAGQTKHPDAEVVNAVSQGVPRVPGRTKQF